MAQTALRQILQQIADLNGDELQEVSHAVQQRLSAQEDARKHEAFHRALQESGLVLHVKTPSPNDSPERQLIEVQGEPVSETIIAERR